MGKVSDVLTCNLGQKVWGKFTKLSTIGFSMECFTANFLQTLTFGWTPGYLTIKSKYFKDFFETS